MNWHSGNIAEAVAESKAKDAIFVVYIEGQDEMSAKLEKFVDDERVRAKLETSDFVAIKVKGDSSAYGQFISLYKVVPIPSIFFIGKTGTPLEIATGITNSAEELVEKIDKVLVLAGKQQQRQQQEDTSSSFIVENTARNIAGADDDNSQAKKENDEKTNREEDKEATSATSAVPASEMPIVEATSDASTASVAPANAKEASHIEKSTVAPAAVAAEKRAAAATAAKAETVDSSPSAPPATSTGPASTLPPAAAPQGQQGRPLTESEVRTAEVQNLLEEKKRERLAQEQRREKENELRRRREGKEAQNQQALSKEQEIKNMQERIRRERQEEQEARERIRAQIAADRAEMTRRILISADTNSLSTGGASAAEAAGSSSACSVDETRLQIRLPGGINRTKSFPAGESLSTVRVFVRKELLAGSNVQDFTLATSYPRREFQVEDESKTLTELNLVPNAVVLVLTKEQVNRVVRTGGSIMTMLATVLWAMLTPAAKAFDYINKMGIQRLTQRLMGWIKPLPQQQTAGGDVLLVPGNTASARRNMDMFVLRPTQNPGNQQSQSSTSSAAAGSAPKAETLTPDPKENAATPQTTPTEQTATAAKPQTQSHQFQQRPGGYQPPRYGDANIRRLHDTKKDDKDNKATYNGNSTQQQ